MMFGKTVSPCLDAMLLACHYHCSLRRTMLVQACDKKIAMAVCYSDLERLLFWNSFNVKLWHYFLTH